VLSVCIPIERVYVLESIRSQLLDFVLVIDIFPQNCTDPHLVKEVETRSVAVGIVLRGEWLFFYNMF
jgi:hypothetical protein